MVVKFGTQDCRRDGALDNFGAYTPVDKHALLAVAAKLFIQG